MATMHYRPGVEAAPGYKLLELLGRGGFGEVWRAQGPGGVILAVKIIDKVDDKAGRKEFRALKLIRNLRHPNLVSISGFWLRDAEGNLLDPELLTDETSENAVHPSELIIAMELGEMSLLERLDECRKGVSPDSKGGIPFDELIEYMDAAARAIDYLNVRHDIQHRDIKPQNILIVGGSAQVCDFGLASAVSSVRTSMGGAGSLAYMAPEIYSSKRPSRATDQYGLAIAYVELRTGRLPLSDTESYAVLDEAKRLGKLDLSWLDEAEARVIEKATQLNPEDRYQRCVDMVNALRAASSPTTTVVGATTESHRPIGDYQPQRQIYRRAGEEIWEAISPERHHVTLVVREVAESPALPTSAGLALTREASKHHPRLAEVYEYARLSETGKVAPARLFEGPNPPGFAHLLLASKLCSGNMNDRMTSGGLSAGQLVDEMEQLAEAVDFLNAQTHETGGRKVRIMHLNLRPANFQFDAGKVLLGNFSSAQLLEGDEAPFPAGRLMPDNAYNAPEFLQEKLTRWSDQYQLAVAYLQMRTGKPSSGLTSSHGGTRRTVGASRLDLSELEDGERKAIERATATEPKERFDSCAELVAALRKAWEDDRAKTGVVAPATEPGATRVSGGTPYSDKTLLPSHNTVISPDSEGGSNSGGVALSAPAIQGTLAAPRFAETLLQPDTDPDGERQLAAERAAAKPAVRPAIAPASRYEPPRSKTAWRMIGLSAAAMGAFAWAGWTYFLSPESKLDDSIKSRIADGSFLEALDDINKSEAKLSDNEREGMRIQVRLAWFKQHVAPLDAQRKYAEALDVLAKADAKLAEPAQIEHWKSEVTDHWYAHAVELAENGDSIRAAREFTALLQNRGPYQRTVDLRSDALDAAIKSGVAKLADKPEETFAAMTEVVEIIDAAKPISILPQDAERTRRRKALVAHARAAGRLSQWEHVKADLKALGDQLATREELALGRLLGLLADARKAAAMERLTEARELLTTSSADLGTWEKQELGKLIASLDRVVGGSQAATFQQQLAAAEKLADAGKYGDAASAVAKIRGEAAFRDLIAGKDQRRLETLAVICTLGRADSKPDDVAKAMTTAHDLCSNNSIAEQAIAKVCDVVRQRAVEKVSAATDSARKSPELLAQALPIVVRAKSRVKVGSDDEKKIQAILQSLAGEFKADLRRLRDAAGTAKTSAATRQQWTQLAAQAKLAEEFGIAANDRVILAARTEAAIELNESGFKPSNSIMQPVPPVAPKPTSDERYVNYVMARALDVSDKFTQAAGALALAWQDQSPSADKSPVAEEPWQLSPARRRASVEILLRSAQQDATGPKHDPTLGADPAKGDRFNPDAAKSVYPQLALARHLAAKAGFDPQVDADAAAERAIAENIALAAAYTPDTAEQGLKLTDDLIDAAGDIAGDKETISTQVYVANLRLRGEKLAKTKQTEDRDRYVRTAGKLLALCEAKYVDVRSTTLFDRVIAPAFEQIVSLGDSISSRTKADAARLAAARGRYIRSIGAIEERFAQSKGGPDQVAYESFDKAIGLDPNVAEYYVGRGLAYQDLLEPTPNEKAKILRENAKLVEQHAANDDQRNIARGLDALATYQESNWVADYPTKRKKLAQAVAELTAVNAKAAQSTSQYHDIYHALRVVEGGGYLHLANYADDKGDKEKFLATAKESVQALIKDDESRVHPEWAILLLGNIEEDEGMFLKKFESYDSALKQFTSALEISQQDNDPKSQSLALLGRGRCRMRQAIHASKNDAERRSRLTEALSDLNESITIAGMWPLRQAEANRWIATIYQHPLFAETAKATDLFDKAAALAKDANPSWPYYELERANHALQLAGKLIDPADLRRPQPPVRDLLTKARGYAQALLDNTTDSRIDERHRQQAAIVVAKSHIWEGAPQKAGELLDQPFKSLKPEESYKLAVGIAAAVFDLPGVERKDRKLTAEDAALSQRAIEAAMSVVKDQPIHIKAALRELDLEYYNYWNPQFNAALAKAKTDPASRRTMLDLMHHVRFHLAAAVALEADPAWKAAGGKVDPAMKQGLVQYTKFLLDPTNGETDWNKPGRDQARYKADAGL